MLGTAVTSRAEFSSHDFDQWYYAAPTPPDARLSAEALNYFVHLTGTASTRLTTDKEYRLFVASRARFFAVQGEGQAAFWHHAESLFPQCFWSQKSLLLEIFKRSREPGIAESLNTWSQSEADDDRRLILEEAALSGSAPEAILEKSPATPQILAEQWAVFFATGNTTVVKASLHFLKRNPSRVLSTGNSAAAIGGNLLSANATLHEILWDKLAQFSRIYPRVRQAFQTLLLNDPLTGMELKRSLEILVWQDLDAGDTPAAQALLPLAEIVWREEPEKLDFFKGELAILNNQPAEAETAAQRLAIAEPLWADRLAAFQARFRWLQATNGLTWNDAQTGGEKFGHLGAQYFKGLKTCRTFDRLTVWPVLVSWDEKANIFEQVKNLQMPSKLKGWQQTGQAQSAWKLENGSLFFWTGRGRPWVEVRDPEVGERVFKAAVWDTWLDLLERQQPKEFKETAGPAGRVRLFYETTALDLYRLWGDTTAFRLPASPEGNSTPIRIIVDLSKADGRVDYVAVEIPDTDGRVWHWEKIFFDQNFKP
jgi:hypothetical protein